MDFFREEGEENLMLQTTSGNYTRWVRKLRKSVIAAFGIQSKQSRSYKTNILISLGFAFVSAVQGVSLVLLRHDNISGYESLAKVFKLVNYARFDALAFDAGLIYPFFYVGLAVVYLPLTLMCGNVALGLYWKKRPYQITVQLMSFSLTVIEQILLLPALVLMFSFIKYTYISSDSSMLEYGDSPELLSSSAIAVVSVITLPLLVSALYINSYFFYDCVYAKRRKLVYSMCDSFVHRVHILSRVVMVILYCFLSSFSHVWYRIGILLLCAVMFILYKTRMTYFNLILNLENCSKKAIIVWAVLAYLIGYATDSAAAIVVLLFFVSPLLMALIYFRTLDYWKQISSLKLRDITMVYQVELKLRVHLEKLEVSADEEKGEIHHKVEKLFYFATTRFTKSPLLYLWEAYYYYHYRSDVFQALLKLSKAHFTNRTLESHFFFSKAADKFIQLEASPERLYLRYLKLLDTAKRSDEFCCLQLTSICSELLSRKLDSPRVETYVKQLSIAMTRTTQKYFKILNHYNDNAEVLKLLGTLMTDILKEPEGKNLEFRAQVMKNSDVRKSTVAGNASEDPFNEELGLVILECTLDLPGFVVLANFKAYEMFKSGSMEAMRKSFVAYLPQEFHSIFASTITELVMFGNWIDAIPQMFQLCLNGEGYLMTVDVSVKLTTWDYKPHILLLVTQLEPREIVVIDAAYTIRAHSRLDSIFDNYQNIFYTGCPLDQVFPGLAERLDAVELDFLYEHKNGVFSRVSIESIDFRDVHLKLVTFQSRTSYRSTAIPLENQDASDRFLQDSRKGVRFIASDQSTFIRSDIRHKTVHEPSSVSMYSEAEAKVKRNCEINTSIAYSTGSSTVTFEVQEGLKVSKSLKRMKLLLIISILLLVTGLITSVIFVAAILNSLKSITTISQLNQRNFEAIKLAYDVRSLMLTDNHSFPYSQDLLLSSIKAHTESLSTLTNYMKSLVGSEPMADDVYLLESKVPMWTKVENKYKFSMSTLLDALYDTTTAGETLTNMSPPYLYKPEAFFIYRNSAGDLLNVGNLTLVIQVKGDQETRMQSLLVIDYLLYMCAALIILPLFVLVGPQLYLFEMQNQNIWKSIYSLPREAILESRNSALDRLQNCFNNEIQLDAVAIKNVERVATPSRVWPKLALKLGIYVLANTLFFVILQVQFFAPVHDLALTIPNYMFWAGLRQKIVTEGSFWMREFCLETGDPELSYKTIIPEGELWWNPLERVTNSSDSIAFIRSVLNFGDPKYGVSTIKKSDAYLDFLLSDACAEVLIGDCAASEVSLGGQYILKEWSQEMSWTVTQGNYSSGLYETMEKFEVQVNHSLEALGYATDFYQNDSITQIDLFSQEIITLSVSFICFLFLLYLLIYSPTIKSLLSTEKQALKIHKLLRTK